MLKGPELRSFTGLKVLIGSVLGGTIVISLGLVGYEHFLESKPVEYSVQKGRNVIKGPGYTISQAEIDPTIVRVIELGNLEQLNGLKRGSQKLWDLCGEVSGEAVRSRKETIFEFKVENADQCLSEPN